MLVLSRERGESIVVGPIDEETIDRLLFLAEKSGRGCLPTDEKQELETILKIFRSQIVFTVTNIRGDKVKLGIQADREVPVHRLEVSEEIRRENLQIGEEMKSRVARRSSPSP